MRKSRLEAAEQECLRLLERIKAIKETPTYRDAEHDYLPYRVPGHLTGAVRRASMDVTRALASLRRHD